MIKFLLITISHSFSPNLISLLTVYCLGRSTIRKLSYHRTVPLYGLSASPNGHPSMQGTEFTLLKHARANILSVSICNMHVQIYLMLVKVPLICKCKYT